MDEHNPYAAPEAEIESGDDADSRLATRWQRFRAAFGDTMFVVIAMRVVLPVLGINGNTSPGASSVTYLITFFMLQSYFLITNGQTLGKKITGIKIVDSDGNLPSFKQILLRYSPMILINSLAGLLTTASIGALAALNILAMADNLLIFRASRKCFHDDLAGTQVIKC